MTLFTIIFLTTGILTLVASIGVITSNNLVRSVFWLAATLLGTAALYVLLRADFVAMIQVLLYTGGVITLMLFGVMLSKRNPGTAVPNTSSHIGRAFAVTAPLLGISLAAIWSTPEFSRMKPIETTGAKEIGDMFMQRQLLAFELLSVLLLAAMVGAIIIARKRAPGRQS